MVFLGLMPPSGSIFSYYRVGLSERNSVRQLHYRNKTHTENRQMEHGCKVGGHVEWNLEASRLPENNQENNCSVIEVCRRRMTLEDVL